MGRGGAVEYFGSVKRIQVHLTLAVIGVLVVTLFLFGAGSLFCGLVLVREMGFFAKSVDRVRPIVVSSLFLIKKSPLLKTYAENLIKTTICNAQMESIHKFSFMVSIFTTMMSFPLVIGL